MVISKIFSKVFGEQIFDVGLSESIDKQSRSRSTSAVTMEDAIVPIQKTSEIPLTE